MVWCDALARPIVKHQAIIHPSPLVHAKSATKNLHDSFIDRVWYKNNDFIHQISEYFNDWLEY